MADVTFESVEYPYRLTLPRDFLFGQWRAASRQWDGTETISSTAQFVDSTPTRNGLLYVAGTAWTGDVDSFVAHVVANVRAGHDCGSPEDKRQATLGDTPAVAFRQTCAGGSTTVHRVATVRDGFGLIAMQMVPSRSSVEELVALLAEFEWQSR